MDGNSPLNLNLMAAASSSGALNLEGLGRILLALPFSFLLNGIPCLVLQAPSFVELCHTALLSLSLAQSSLNSIKNCN